MAGSPSERIESLPRWDLGDLYSGTDAPELARDLEGARGLAKDFGARYRGCLGALDGAAWATPSVPTRTSASSWAR